MGNNFRILSEEGKQNRAIYLFTWNHFWNSFSNKGLWLQIPHKYLFSENFNSVTFSYRFLEG